MSINAFKKKLEKSEPAPVYVITGSEDLLKREALAAVREKIFGPADPGMNLAEFDAKEKDFNPAVLLDELRTMPFMGGGKMVVLDNAGKLDKDATALLARYAEKPSSFATLVLVDTEKARGAGRLGKKIKSAEVFVGTPLREKDIPGWIVTRSKIRGAKLPGPVVMMLLDLFGTDLAELDGAIEKLGLLTEPGKEVSVDEAREFLRKKLGCDVFAFTGAVASRKLPHALEIVSDIFDAGMVEQDGTRETNEMALFSSRLIPMLLREFRRIYEARRMLKKGIPRDEIAKKLRVHPYFSRKFFDDAARYSDVECLSAVEHVVRADRAVKRSFSSPRLALEECLIRCMKTRRPQTVRR